MKKKLSRLKPTATPWCTPTLDSRYTQPTSRTPNPPMDGKDVATHTSGEKITKYTRPIS